VELVPQTSNVSCWAAGTAMLVGWRDLVVILPQDIAEGVGYWAQYHNIKYSGKYFNRTGLPPDDLNMFEVWGLVPETKLTFTVEEFANLLDRYGPLWVATAEDLVGRGNTNPHIRVITGIKGDGTPNGTKLYINDPWDKRKRKFSIPNSGAIYTETYAEFLRKQKILQDKEIKKENLVNSIYVAHN
jgi:hypothetical protein